MDHWSYSLVDSGRTPQNSTYRDSGMGCLNSCGMGPMAAAAALSQRRKPCTLECRGRLRRGLRLAIRLRCTRLRIARRPRLVAGHTQLQGAHAGVSVACCTLQCTGIRGRVHKCKLQEVQECVCVYMCVGGPMLMFGTHHRTPPRTGSRLGTPDRVVHHCTSSSPASLHSSSATSSAPASGKPCMAEAEAVAAAVAAAGPGVGAGMPGQGGRGLVHRWPARRPMSGSQSVPSRCSAATCPSRSCTSTARQLLQLQPPPVALQLQSALRRIAAGQWTVDCAPAYTHRIWALSGVSPQEGSELRSALPCWDRQNCGWPAMAVRSPTQPNGQPQPFTQPSNEAAGGRAGGRERTISAVKWAAEAGHLTRHCLRPRSR